jgi:hypothetical protein
MGFFKHVGECNGKKVIIVQRQLPGEGHMAGVVYSEIIPSRFHDDLMKVLESPEGQQYNDFNQVLKRRYFSNGENMLDSLLAEGFIKKAATNNIIVKPNSKSAVRLDELNRLIGDISNGRAAESELEVVAPGAKKELIDATEAKPTESSEAKAPDSTELMMELMKTMKAMQEEIAALKKDKPKKTTSKTV